MSKIGVISDTHNCLREPAIKLLQGCDAILHAGDFCNASTFRQLKAIAPLYAVRGNADKWASGLPETLSLELFGLKIFMIHNRKAIKTERLVGKDLIIYGHSHKYEEESSDSHVWLNPGSCGARRFLLPSTMAVVHIEGGHAFQIERIDFTDSSKASCAASLENKHAPEYNIRTIVQNVMKETDKGKTVSAIAKKNHISEDLASLICRLYLTHPGVDADGILKKMGL